VETELVAETSLGEVIDRARRRSFVGRRSELRAFDHAQAALSPRRVLFVHGPGGIGKTTLLLEMRARVSATGASALWYRAVLRKAGLRLCFSPSLSPTRVSAAPPGRGRRAARGRPPAR
jgi:hypothetical protein